jgi:uncharacterized protein (TIGR03435 family)
MKKSVDTFASRCRLLFSTAVLMAVALAIVFGIPSRTSASTFAPAQNYPSAAPVYEFDVATIKPNLSNNPGGVLGFLTEDSFRARNMNLRSIIRWAYGMWGGQPDRVLGGPNWLDTDRYEIVAKVDPSVADALKRLPPDQRTLMQERMVQKFLADRFKLAIHLAPKESSVYALVIAKNGPKLHDAVPGDSYEHAFEGGPAKAGDIIGVMGSDSSGQTMTLSCFGVSMPALARRLTVQAGQLVEDRTGLTGSYDFTLKYWLVLHMVGAAPEAAADAQSAVSASDPAGGPSLFSAIQQQLGLKLDSTKGHIDLVVIDHVEKPSGN